MIIAKTKFFFSGHNFKVKKYLIIDKNNPLLFTIGIEKVFKLKNSFLAKNFYFKAMRTSHSPKKDQTFKRSFVLHNMIFKL